MPCYLALFYPAKVRCAGHWRGQTWPLNKTAALLSQQSGWWN